MILLYLSFSEHEGFGVPLLESFRMRIPVVALAAGAVEETMNGGGIILREKDFFRTAALLDRLIEDNEFKEKIIDAQLKALKKYDRTRVGSILLDHVERVNRG